MRVPIMLALAAMWATCTAAPLHAQADEDITYQVKSGDTLHRLTEAYFVNPAALKQVQRINRIADPHVIATGKVLTIPRSLLRYRELKIEVLSFSGTVTVGTGSRSVPVQTGMTIAEGAIIATGPKGFVSLGLERNSRITLPSNSRVRFDGARQYMINDAIDFDVRVLTGRSEIIAPKLRAQERFRVGTPVAVTAVRGTEFRVNYDDKRAVGTSETIEGIVSVSTGDETFDAIAGTGIAAGTAGLSPPEQLLTAPELRNPGKIQTDENLHFTVGAIEGASGYRTQIARDAGFIEIIAETQSDGPDITISEPVEDGRLFVRTRAIAQSGLEGLARTHSFRRKRLGAEASVDTGGAGDALKFAWRSIGEGTSYMAFQLWRSGEPGVLLVDEAALTGNALLIDRLPAGTYQWRVAIFQIDEGEPIKVWGPTQELQLTD